MINRGSSNMCQKHRLAIYQRAVTMFYLRRSKNMLQFLFISAHDRIPCNLISNSLVTKRMLKCCLNISECYYIILLNLQHILCKKIYIQKNVALHQVNISMSNCWISWQLFLLMSNIALHR